MDEAEESPVLTLALVSAGDGGQRNQHTSRPVLASICDRK